MTEINWLLKLKNAAGVVQNPRKEDGHGSAVGTPTHVQVGTSALPAGAATEVTLAARSSEATLALVKAKTDNLDLALTALRDALLGVDSKTLSDIVAKDFATAAKQNPLDKYRIADIDKATSVKYYGFTSVTGAWFILREDRSAAPNTYRYVNVGAVDYPTAWTNRATLSYVYLHQLTNL